MDLNKFYEDFKKDPYITRINLIQEAIKELKEALIGYKIYKDGILNQEELLEFLHNPDYEEILGWLGWPNFNDDGIFYQCINIACDTLLQAYHYKPLNYLSEYENLENK